MRVDVAVVGAGAAGATAAFSLARQGVQVLLLDRSDGQRFRIGESLPPIARPLLQTLGLWERFTACAHLPSYGNRSAWGSSHLASTDFVFNPYGHGWHLDRQAFDTLLVEAAVDAGAQRLSSTRVMQCVVGDTGGVLDLQSGARQWTVLTQAVLDCSGRSAVVAHKQGVRRMVYDKLVALTTLLTSPTGEDRDSTTMIESSPGGWWYTALLPRQLRIMVYLTDSDLLHVPSARDLDHWQRQLHQTEHMRFIYERFAYQAVGPPWVVSANSSRLVHTTGARWVAAGDAAVSFDPLSSQGIITAMTTGQQATAALLDDLGGDRGARGAYEASLDRLYQEYLTQRTRYYRIERRWPDSVFWQRRSFSAPSPGLT